LQFEYTNPQTELEKAIGGFFCINAIGLIEPGDDARFRQFLACSQPPPRATVYLDSAGGDVEAAMGIGRAIRENWYSTAVGTYLLRPSDSHVHIVKREWHAGKCLSAATLIFLGGRLRYFEEKSKFGVHQFSFKNPSPANVAHSQVLSAKISRYVVDMGISPELLELASSVNSSDIKLLSENELKRLKVVTGGQTDVDWSVQARARMLYVRGERDSLYGHHKVMLCFVKGAGFIFYSVIESQGRESELTTFPLVEIVVNGESIRIDVSDRCERLVEGIYVNVFAKLTQEEARILAYSDSFGVQIRASGNAPLFLGVAAMSTEGGREQLETFFSAVCD
jgi:hypothetical protein